MPSSRARLSLLPRLLFALAVLALARLGALARVALAGFAFTRLGARARTRLGSILTAVLHAAEARNRGERYTPRNVVGQSNQSAVDLEHVPGHEGAYDHI